MLKTFGTKTVGPTLEVGEHLNRIAVGIIPSFIFSHSNLILISSQHSNRRANFRKNAVGLRGLTWAYLWLGQPVCHSCLPMISHWDLFYTHSTFTIIELNLKRSTVKTPLNFNPVKIKGYVNLVGLTPLSTKRTFHLLSSPLMNKHAFKRALQIWQHMNNM